MCVGCVVCCAAFALRHGVKKYYTDAEKLINDPDVDAVYIATPPGSHAAYASLVCAAGKPCYVEKVRRCTTRHTTPRHATSLRMTHTHCAECARDATHAPDRVVVCVSSRWRVLPMSAVRWWTTSSGQSANTHTHSTCPLSAQQFRAPCNTASACSHARPIARCVVCCVTALLVVRCRCTWGSTAARNRSF